MDLVKVKDKKGLIVKTWERCMSFRGTDVSGSKSFVGVRHDLRKSKSLPRLDAKTGKPLDIAPKGCFPIYVGPQRQRFAVKTEYANHPLFTALLEEAEYEYGYKSYGPLELPCEVDDFVKVLLEMDARDEIIKSPGCMFGTKGRRYGSYHQRPPCKTITND